MVIGVIIIVVLLLVLFPVGIMVTGAMFASMVATITKKSVDNEFVGTEDLEISQANPYRDA